MTHINRLKKLQQRFKEQKCDALLISHPTDLFYLTGISLSAGKLLVHTHGSMLLVDARYYELCQKSSPFPVSLSTETSLNKLLDHPDYTFIKKIGFCQDLVTYQNYKSLQKELNRIRTRKITLKPLDNPIIALRMIKDEQELDLLRKAAKLGSSGYDYLCDLLKTGISEAELAIKLEIFWKEKGGKALAFDPIIAFGANSSMPHYQTSTAKLKKGDAVLMDIGVNLCHYHSDMTRTVFFGEPKAKMLEIYTIVLEAQLAALKKCKPGTLVKDLDRTARDHIAKKGYGEHFTHSLGHGIGLDVHEGPLLNSKSPHKDYSLQPGMVITIEPGIYLPGIGGVRIEDTVIITEKGHENLTNRDKSPLQL